jgi:SAICAR synthetase
MESPQPDGLLESEKFPMPLFTPSTKAEQGAHDENISPERGVHILLYLLNVTHLGGPQLPLSSGKSCMTRSPPSL